jgi:hypothetical protein
MKSAITLNSGSLGYFNVVVVLWKATVMDVMGAARSEPSGKRKIKNGR